MAEGFPFVKHNRQVIGVLLLKNPQKDAGKAIYARCRLAAAGLKCVRAGSACGEGIICPISQAVTIEKV